MRILIATQHLEIAGGVETYLRTAIPMLQDRGHDLAVLVGTRLSVGETIVDRARPLTVLSSVGKSTAATMAELCRWKPDLVYSQCSSDIELERAILDQFPALLFVHTYFGTCISGTKCQSYPTPTPCDRRFGFGCLVRYLPRRCGGRNPLKMVQLYRAQNRRLDNMLRYRRVLAGSKHMIEECAKHGVAVDRLTLAPLFPTQSRPDECSPSFRPRSDRVLFAGRIAENKGWRHLMQALPLAATRLGRRLTLVVAGDGPDRLALKAEGISRGIALKLLGWVAAERVQQEMRRADVLAIPSVWPEPFGLTGIEAGCVGLPSVGYAVGGIPDWLRNGDSGEAAPGNEPNPIQLADAFVRALRQDDSWQRLRAGAWRVAQEFSADKHMEILNRAFVQG